MKDEMYGIHSFIMWLNKYKEKHKKMMFDAMNEYNAYSVQYYLERIEQIDNTFMLLEEYKGVMDE